PRRPRGFALYWSGRVRGEQCRPGEEDPPHRRRTRLPGRDPGGGARDAGAEGSRQDRRVRIACRCPTQAAIFARRVTACQGRWLGAEVFTSSDKKAVKLSEARGDSVHLLP